MTSLSGIATKESCEHLLLFLIPPRQMVGTKGFCPGLTSINLMLSQSLHLILSLEALMKGLVELMMIP